MLSVVCFKWKPPPGFRTHFMGQHVNVLRNMVERHYAKKHRFICVTDDPSGIDEDIEIIELWKDHARLASPAGRDQPSCFRRLKIFSAGAEALFGKRFVTVDLDAVIMDDLAPVWDREEDFVIWGDTAKGTPYNGSMILMTAGARQSVWDQFDPSTSPYLGKQLGYIGSDQAWIGACLGKGERIWTKDDGVISFRNEILMRKEAVNGARIVFFHGKQKPWHKSVAMEHPWIKEHWN